MGVAPPMRFFHVVFIFTLRQIFPPSASTRSTAPYATYFFCRSIFTARRFVFLIVVTIFEFRRVNFSLGFQSLRLLQSVPAAQPVSSSVSTLCHCAGVVLVLKNVSNTATNGVRNCFRALLKHHLHSDSNHVRNWCCPFIAVEIEQRRWIRSALTF